MDANKVREMIDITAFAASCTECDLCMTRVKPVFARGNINSKIIICGMCPGPDENQAGIPFIGAAGQILDSIISESFGSTPVYITNLVKCFVQPGRKLEEEWINACLPYFISQVGLIQPKVILLLGKDVCGYFTNNKFSMGSLRGNTFSYMRATAIMTYHPSFLARGGGITHPDYNTVVKDFKKSLSFF